MAPPMKRPGTTVLPTKERGLFTRLIQEYETKKYKTGLKTADTILKKYPEHGETLCMKGLILASLDQKAEGLELAKLGVRYDLTSFISWHALGILNRIVKNYNESIKCYSQALRIEGGTNINLIRESAYLYLQLRDWQKVVENRVSLIRMQPHFRMYWAGLAVALHLGGDPNEAVRVLEQFESVHRDIPKHSYEHSEILLYHGLVLHEAQRHQEAIDLLESNKAQAKIVDSKSADFLKGKCQLALEKRDDAKTTFASLLERNMEDRDYVFAWLQANGVSAEASSDDERQKAIDAFSELRSRFPKSRVIQRLSLVYLSGDAFRQEAVKYIQAALRKGVPSIFNDVKTLYGDQNKCKAIEEIVQEARRDWSSNSEPPSSLLWVLYFLAQHYSTLRRSDLAIAYIDSAIAHSPAIPDLHMARARILKRAGSLLWASHAINDARLLDGQDRYLNCKTAKYLLRAGDTDRAKTLAGMFTKPDVPDPVLDLAEMQASWYLIEEARAWKAKENYAMALKRCNQIDKIYTEIWDDQLDFHSYCTRKFTLRSYVQMVRFEDRLHAHPAYFTAATTAVEILLKLHDTPALYKPNANGAADGPLTDEQRKEAKKQRKQEIKAAEEATKKAKNTPAKQDKKTDDEETIPLPKDDDPDGLEAFRTVDPLPDAKRFLAVLEKHAPKRIETWLLSFEVALRERNWLLATKAVAQAHSLDPDSGNVHLALIKLRVALPALDAAPEQVAKSIDAVLSPLIPLDVPLESYRATFVQQNAHRADAQLAGARALLVLRKDDPNVSKDAAAMLFDLVKQQADSHTKSTTPQDDTSAVSCTLDVLIQAQQLYHTLDAANTSAFDALARQVYPLADVFKKQEDLEKEADARQEEVQEWAASPDAADGVNGTNG